MSNLGDGAISNGDVLRQLQELRREVRELKAARRLESSSIGSGGLRLHGGGGVTVDGNGNINLNGGDLIVSGNGRIISGDPNGERAETTKSGYQVIDANGQVAIDLTIAGKNLIRMVGESGDKDTEILLVDGSGNFRQVNAEEIYLNGEKLSELIAPSSDPGTFTYNATWTESYRGSNQPSDLAEVKQGYFGSFNGNERGLVGFDSAQIQSDLTGLTVTKVRVYLYANHWYYNAGGTGVLGHHGHTAAPGTFSASAVDVVRSANWPKPGARWVAYEHSMQEWATGAKTGIVTGPGPSASRTYYGAFDGFGQGRPPKLEITAS